MHEALCLHTSDTTVVSALQLLTEVHYLCGHVGDAVLQLMKLTERFLDEKHDILMIGTAHVSFVTVVDGRTCTKVLVTERN